MGYGLGAAVGGCMASGRKTILFTGDGSFGMNLTELATAVTHKLPVVVIILNNSSLGLPRQWQHMFYGDRFAQSNIERKTDFPALARAFGACGHLANSLDELSSILENTPDDLPTVIECRIDINEMVLPMIPPGGSIKDMIVKG